MTATSVARGLLKAAGVNPRHYVPGSLRIVVGGLMDWTERCGPRCQHVDECHVGRSGLVPTGYLEEQ